jgi:flavorubredoxin
MNAGPQTQVDEIAPDIFRMSTWVPDITENGFTFNQFLLTGDEPMLFHCGHRQLFPAVSAAINQVVPLEKLRWISFGHIEADECRRTQRRSHPRCAGMHGVVDRLV